MALAAVVVVVAEAAAGAWGRGALNPVPGSPFATPTPTRLAEFSHDGGRSRSPTGPADPCRCSRGAEPAPHKLKNRDAGADRRTLFVYSTNNVRESRRAVRFLSLWGARDRAPANRHNPGSCAAIRAHRRTSADIGSFTSPPQLHTEPVRTGFLPITPNRFTRKRSLLQAQPCPSLGQVIGEHRPENKRHLLQRGPERRPTIGWLDVEHVFATVAPDDPASHRALPSPARRPEGPSAKRLTASQTSAIPLEG